ncbi:MAG: hypothetical protein J3R72DRAFT_445489 [Linnemannia gamsii]|nr:MAG: hypothetical protein J3R72DRAFT_445489 [Linnemannia gamsii]
MQQRDPLDLPEIRALLGPFLTLDSLYSCVLVNWEWHDTFTPFLWTTFYFGRETHNTTLQPPSEASIQQYAHFIQRMVVRSLSPTFQLDMFKDTPLTQLKELRLCEAIGRSKSNGSLAWIFQQNPGLRVVDYDGGYSSTSSDSSCTDFEVLLNSPALTDLTTQYVNYQQKHLEPFRQLCATRLKRASFYMDTFSMEAQWLEIPMPHLQELCIRNIGPMSGLQTILQCPNLRTLRWVASNTQSASSFQQIMEVCPRLKAIDLQSMALTDESIARVLDGLRESATEVIIPGRKDPFGRSGAMGFGFKTKAFAALSRRHFGTLVVLDMGPNSLEVTSAMILQVLTSCPNLREITACQLYAKGIRDGPGVWACRKLEVFKVMIRGFRDPLIDQIRIAVFRRFATLPRLRVLHMGGQDPSEEGVALRLECGLAQLAGLAQLESVSVYPGPQKMRREDVEWIRAHWKGLRVLNGCLHSVQAVTDVIREVLTSRGKATDEGFERLAFHTANHRY